MADYELDNLRHSDVAYVLAKLRVRGVDHLLLHAHAKWGDWSLVGGHVEATDPDWDSAASREVEEEMSPLRFGDDLDVETLSVPMSEWGPVPSVSADGLATCYRARWYVLRFKANPAALLAKLPSDEFVLIPVPELERFRPLSSLIPRARDLLGDWKNLPLSWDLDLDESPLPVPVAQRPSLSP